MVRHGQTEKNLAHVIDSVVPGANLSVLGREQAAQLPKKFEGIEIDAIYVTNLVRTHQTAAPLAHIRGITPIEDARMREIEAGEWEGGGSEEDYKGYLSTIAHWVAGDLDMPMGGGVTGREVLDRYDAAVADIEASGAQNVVVVSHGGIIGFWSAVRGDGIRPEDVLWSNHLGNTEMSVVEGTLAQGYRCLSWKGIDISAR